MADYDNSRYTYAQVLAGNGYYMKDDKLRFSAGVKTMQTKFNTVGYNCGTPDGQFGDNTNTVVIKFQKAKSLTPDGKAGQLTLKALDDAVSGGGSSGGSYPVNFNGTNQQAVYSVLKGAGLSKIAIAGIMGNIEAESGYSTAWSGDQGSVGICQWLSGRKSNLEAFATSISGSKTSITVQAKFILEECKSGSKYADSLAVKCMSNLKDSSTITSVKKAADYFTALYERCYLQSTWSGVVDACNGSSWLSVDRFSQDPNLYNSKFYLDTPKRRGYAESYYQCLLKL
jgi:hypothetical protein